MGEAFAAVIEGANVFICKEEAEALQWLLDTRRDLATDNDTP
jgi:hypothetical protein